MRIEMAGAPGSPERPDEDWAAGALPASGHGGFVVALDGVTPPAHDVGCSHTVPWFTSRLGGSLAELSVSHPDLTLPEVLAESIRRTADVHRTSCDLSHPRTPQATVALARWDARTIEYLVLCDAVLLLEAPDGAVRAVLDDRLDRLPRSALASVATVDATLRNREGGFFTAAADPSVASRAVTGRAPLTEVRSVTAMSDGASRWTERFHQGDWAALLGVVRESGPRGLIERVRELERADAAGPAPLGGKTHDDAAVVFAEF
ncbi:protein phosphatase 2C domain-containing protein [uncultured Streptomyces sp.]|uniref:protein phosphatase 2C domain-containing protein n=1 Tax=uncultured Streptomyces sp. TaxID=174707 RepID=UPI0026290E50|nr:protein phosphatase 2C domain-containing protein [uncultured Streptomyces sp.]